MEYNKFLKDKFSSYYNFFKNKFNSNDDKDNIQLIERNRKILYFSKFTLDIDEIHSIYNTTRSIKENILKNMIDSIKYCGKDILKFLNNESENDKIVIIFTICYLHFYTNYNENYTFEQFYTKELFNIFSRYNVFISNTQQFQVFCFAFFHQSIKETQNFDYKQLKKMYQYYDRTIIDEQNNLIEEVKKNDPHEKNKNFINKLANYTKSKLYIPCITKKVFTPLISATERVVDIILSMDENKINDISKNEGQIIIEKKKDTTDEIKSKDYVNKTYSKRIICELVKSENNKTENELAIEISEKVNNLVDMILNHSQNKFYCIKEFLCYIVEINSDLIRIFPEYKDLKDDMNLRFIVISKNVYNLAFEIYFTLHDLYKMGANDFIHIFKTKFSIPIDENMINTILFLYKCLNEEFFTKNDSNNNIFLFLESFLDKLFTFWEWAIVEKGRELTRFSTI